MSASSVSILAVVIIMATSLLLLVGMKWRVSIIVLAIQYLAVFWLISLVWTPGQAAVKLVIGLMSCALIGSSLPDEEVKDPFPGIFGNIFQLVLASMVWLLVFAIAPEIVKWFPTGLVMVWGGFILIGVGVMQIGIATHELRVVFALLTILSGFEVIYASVENSILVTGLLAVINLGIALVGTYLSSNSGGSELS